MKNGQGCEVLCLIAFQGSGEAWAPALCSSGLASRTESLVTTTTAAPVIYGEDGLPIGEREKEPYNFDKETNRDTFQHLGDIF